MYQEYEEGVMLCLKNTNFKFSIWPFKCQFSVAAWPLFNSNVHHRTMFSLINEKHLHLMGQLCHNYHYITA